MNYRIIALSAVTGLVALSSCTKEDSAPAKPYYQFTADDRAWLLASPPGEWVFENAQGQRRRYLLRESTEIKQSYITGQFGILGTTTNYTYDERIVDFVRVDTFDVLSVTVKRDLPVGVDKTNPPKRGSILSVQVNGGDLLGTFPDDILNRGYTFEPFRVPTGPELIRRQQYADVVRLEGGPVCSICVRPRRIQRVAYDRQYGIVRMESVTGEVWERVR